MSLKLGFALCCISVSFVPLSISQESTSAGASDEMPDETIIASNLEELWDCFSRITSKSDNHPDYYYQFKAEIDSNSVAHFSKMDPADYASGVAFIIRSFQMYSGEGMSVSNAAELEMVPYSYAKICEEVDSLFLARMEERFYSSLLVEVFTSSDLVKTLISQKETKALHRIFLMLSDLERAKLVLDSEGKSHSSDYERLVQLAPEVRHTFQKTADEFAELHKLYEEGEDQKSTLAEDDAEYITYLKGIVSKMRRIQEGIEP